MLHALRLRLAVFSALAALVSLFGGCTTPQEYFRNAFKVGPSYGPPAAPLPKQWIDADDKRLQQCDADLSCWWGVFNDPLLNRLIVNAYRQNLTLRQAGYRVLQARALRGIAAGNIFPQQQNVTGSYNRIATTGGGAGDRYFSAWNTDFNLSWELDFWGRFRRAIAAADDNLDASVADYDQVIVTLLSDVAANYVQIRTDQERIKLLWKNVKIQVGVFQFIEKQYKVGFGHVTELDYDQALSNLRQTQAAIPQLTIDMRQAENRLCVLLGMPVVDLDKILGIQEVNLGEEELAKISDEDFDKMLGNNRIPTAPPEVVINLPADLLRQRPDIRAAERRAAAQGELIGIAESDLYPAFSINGTLGFSALQFRDLFRPEAFNGSVGPSFRWNVLNYGRILNNVRFEDARFRELVLAYQQTVLLANEEVEDGIVAYLRSQERERLLKDSEEAAVKAVNIVLKQYEIGTVDFNRYAVIQQNLVFQQDAYAQSIGQIAQGLIQVYRALGGGWEMRFAPAMAAAPLTPVPLPPVAPNAAPQAAPNAAPQPAPEQVPTPNPNNPPVPAEIPKPPEQP
ncbi:MAG: TolC family protein [Pirellulales bacterium]|nr:TolC family protein [Pirellulales bacterium]